MTPLRVGRYTLHEPIGSGGMATVYAGTASGAGGFTRQVAIKRLRDDFLGDQDAVAMLLDEARLVGRIHHPHVVSTLDVVHHDGELLLVMEYVPGVSLAELVRGAAARSAAFPLRVALRIIVQVLDALGAAHTATGSDGTALGIVHRDVSPQNILIGSEGIARIADFGVAKAAGRVQTTRDGQLKGKLGYMAPEQVCGGHVDCRTDIYAAGVVLWELLTGERLFDRDTPAATVNAISNEKHAPPSKRVAGLPAGLDTIVGAALSKDPDERPSTAPQMAADIAANSELATEAETSAFVALCCSDLLRERSRFALDSASEWDADAAMPRGMAERLAKAGAAEEPTFVGAARSAAPKRSTLWALPLLVLVAGLALWLALKPTTRGEAAVPLGAPDGVAAQAIEPLEPQPAAKVSVAAQKLGSKPLGDAESPVADPSPDAEKSHQNSAPRPAPRPAKRPSAPSAPSASPSQIPDCDPPYLVDAEGAKQYKLECL